MTGERPYVERGARERAFLQVRGIAVSIGMQSRIPGMEPRDIVSELMLYLWVEVLPRYDARIPLHQFAAWTLRKRVSALLKCAYRFKQATVLMHTGADAEIWEVMPDTARPVDEVVVSRVYAAEIAPLLCQRLSPLERRVADALATGCDLQEAADVLGVKYKAVDNALHRARRKLKEIDR